MQSACVTGLQPMSLSVDGPVLPQLQYLWAVGRCSNNVVGNVSRIILPAHMLPYMAHAATSFTCLDAVGGSQHVPLLWVQLACALGGDAHAETKHVGDPVCWAAPTL